MRLDIDTLKHEYAVAGDGRFLINTLVGDAAAPITLLLNWQGGLAAGPK